MQLGNNLGWEGHNAIFHHIDWVQEYSVPTPSLSIKNKMFLLLFAFSRFQTLLAPQNLNFTPVHFQLAKFPRKVNQGLHSRFCPAHRYGGQ